MRIACVRCRTPALLVRRAAGMPWARSMDRRTALSLLPGLLALPVSRVGAQPVSKVPAIGVPLIAAGPDDRIMVNLRAGLRERGYVEGDTIQIEHRSAGGNVERLPALAREL